MKEQIFSLLWDTLTKLEIQLTKEQKAKINITYPDSKLGDYATNAALILSKDAKMKPMDLAVLMIEKLDKSKFEKVEAVNPGFVNFRLKTEQLLKSKPLNFNVKGKILLEYFQPNIAKPLHMGHLRTAVIGDAIKRMLKFVGAKVESDTHMGDWGTQFGYLILAKKKFGSADEKNYAQLNAEAETDPTVHEAAKQEFVKLEKGDAENKKMWQEIVDESVKQFLQINDLMDILPFDHHWPESFYEDKMPAILEELKKKNLLIESQGARIVNLENQKLGVAVIVKSDGGTTYLLRDLATFVFAQQRGFAKHLYVVDNRQAHHYNQLFAILKLMGKMEEGEGVHINYGFLSFKGEVLSTRKGNMVFAMDVIQQAEEKVSKIIAEKNPDLKDKNRVVKAVTKSALKYFDLKHNRHSDIDFDWDEVLDLEGDSGPYLQYSYARLASILKKTKGQMANDQFPTNIAMTNTERELLFKVTLLPEVVADSLREYLPNILANYLYNLATLINKFYHESPVTTEKDEIKKQFRLALVDRAREVLGQGLDLLGIEALDEM